MAPPTPPSANVDGVQGNIPGAQPSIASAIHLQDFILRFLAFATTFIAAIVMGTTKQTKTIGDLSITAKTTGDGASQLEFFIGANAIACVYAAVSTVLTVVAGSKSVAKVVVVVDLVMVGFVFSAVGSAAAVSVYLHTSNDSSVDGAVCDSFGRFCQGLAAGMAISTFGAVAYLVLVLLVLLGLQY